MRILIVLSLLWALPGCGGPPTEETDEPAGPAAADTIVSPAEQAVSLAQRLDERLSFGAGRATTITDVDDIERTLRLWRENGQPVRLTATEPTTRGPRTGQSAFYFEQDRLFFASDPLGRYVFDGDRLTTWLDERLRPVDVPEEQRAEQEAVILDRVERYLAEFE